MSFAKLAAAVIAPEPTEAEEDQPTRSLNRKLLLGSILGLGALAGGGYAAWDAMNKKDPVKTWGEILQALKNKAKSVGNYYDTWGPAFLAASFPGKAVGRLPYIGRFLNRISGAGFGGLDTNLSDFKARMDMVRENMPDLKGHKDISGALHAIRRLITKGESEKPAKLNVKINPSIKPTKNQRNDPKAQAAYAARLEAQLEKVQQASKKTKLSPEERFNTLQKGIGKALDPAYKKEILRILGGKMTLEPDLFGQINPTFEHGNLFRRWIGRLTGKKAEPEITSAGSFLRATNNLNELAAIPKAKQSLELQRLLKRIKSKYKYDAGTLGSVFKDYNASRSGNFGVRPTLIRAGIGAGIGPTIRWLTGGE